MHLNPRKWFSSGAPDAEPTHGPPDSPKWSPSPNFSTRVGAKIDTIVLHNTTSPGPAALAWLCNDASEVSAHYLVDRDGAVHQLVKDDLCAWHAGSRAVNQRSIGIEVVAYKSALGMTPIQEAALVSLVRSLVKRYGIAPVNIIPHRQVRATECPSLIWPTDVEFHRWVDEHITAAKG